ncbi:MAG: condensation domain-containing protein [Bacteroidota bacterium]
MSTAYQYQSYPFDVLIDDLNLDYSPNRYPLFDFMVMLQNMNSAERLEDETDALGDLQIAPYATQAQYSKLDIKWAFFDIPGKIAMKMEYNPNLFEKESIQLIQENLEHLLQRIVDQPQVGLDQLEIRLSQDELDEHEAFLSALTNG